MTPKKPSKAVSYHDTPKGSTGRSVGQEPSNDHPVPFAKVDSLMAFLVRVYGDIGRVEDVMRVAPGSLLLVGTEPTVAADLASAIVATVLASKRGRDPLAFMDADHPRRLPTKAEADELHREQIRQERRKFRAIQYAAMLDRVSRTHPSTLKGTP